MNKNQKILLIVVAIVLVAMLLYPPFEYKRFSGGIGITYTFLFTEFSGRRTVDIPLLLVQMLVVAIVSGIGWFVLRDDKKGGKE